MKGREYEQFPETEITKTLRKLVIAKCKLELKGQGFVQSNNEFLTAGVHGGRFRTVVFLRS